jgi:hypothetical protein
MPLVCPRCHRANPGEAVYCHFDGSALRTAVGPVHAPNAPFPHEFVFPSSRRCRNFDDLVQGCQYEWEDARSLLKQGRFAQFLAGIGRMDLVRAAQQAQTQSDPDIGLHNFVAALPAAQVQGPRLELNPRRLTFGPLKPGESRKVRVVVSNGGKGLLQGKVSVTEGSQWLRLEDGNGQSQCFVKTAREQPIGVHLDTRGLSGPQTYSACLTVITNGGIAEVPVRLDVASSPFSRSPFQGATNPRDLAERMRAQPKSAVPLLESGEVARWFAANGWRYPVEGSPARSVAAVQQFFEGMGLSKPPPLRLSQDEVRVYCQFPEVTLGHVTLATQVRKWVYAEIDSDAPWLRITTPTVSGPQQAMIAFEVDSSMMDAGREHQAMLRVRANAGQRLALRVHVDVGRPPQAVSRRLLRPLLAGLLLAVLYRLVLSGPADILARVVWPAPATAHGAGSFPTWLEAPSADGGFVRMFVLCTWWVGAVAGGIIVWGRGKRLADAACGAIAGAVAGAIGSATLACGLAFLDSPARGFWRIIEPTVPASLRDAAWLWVAVWIVVASAAWGVGGALIGFLAQLGGKRGIQLLAWAARPWEWTFRSLGCSGVARLFAFS